MRSSRSMTNPPARGPGSRLKSPIASSPQIVLNHLYTYTQMQTTFGVIMLAIVDGEPKTLTLKEILEEYLRFQEEVVTRRTAFELKKAKERAHILEGLRIALDDMGAGFNSISTLAMVRADFIKIDRTLVHEAQGSRVRSVLLEAIVSMADRLGATVIAEGLERPEDLAFCQGLGIRLAQGYLFAHPEPVEDFIARLRGQG